MSAQRIDDREAVIQLPASLQKWLILERFHLHKVDQFQNRSLDPAFDTRYFPQNCGALELPCFWVLRKHLQVYGRQIPDPNELSLLGSDDPGERVLFPIHPSSLDHYRAFLSEVAAEDASVDGLRIWAVPTSSTRTLLAWPDQQPEKACFIKASLHSPIFGDRHLYPRTVGRSVGLSALVFDSRANLPDTLGYLPEPVGFVPRRLPNGGVVVRSIPREIKEGRILVAPMFSLLGGSGSHVPLFLTLLEHSGMQPRQLLEDVLCAPFVKLWLEMSMQFGLLLEAHGQDLMLALAPDLNPLGRFFYRDFEGLQVDWELRQRRGLPALLDMPHGWSWRETYATLGYPYTEFAWCKLRMSLLYYLHFVLNELELSLRQWHERGLVRGPTFEAGEVTMIFSRHLLKAIEDMFGMRAGPQYNIYQNLNRFVIFLVRLRREIIATQPPALARRT